MEVTTLQEEKRLSLEKKRRMRDEGNNDIREGGASTARPTLKFSLGPESPEELRRKEPNTKTGPILFYCRIASAKAV